MLSSDDKLKTVFTIGKFLDNHITEEEKYNLYAINKFFVEVVYDGVNNKILKTNGFKEGYLLDKYSPNLNELL